MFRKNNPTCCGCGCLMFIIIVISFIICLAVIASNSGSITN